MSRPSHGEFDRTLISQARERSEASYLKGIENPSPAIVFDKELVQRAKGRSDASHITTKEVRFQKLQYNATLQNNWARTERDKKNRIIRDLQFELATNSIVDLRKTRSNAAHRDAQVDGIAAFEVSLFKSGLGGGDEEGGTLGINYENGEAFLERIEDLAKKTSAKDSEISNFVTQLKSRTKEKKAARHEKERRRRKTAASQSSPAVPEQFEGPSSGSDNAAGGGDDSSDEELTMDIGSLTMDRRTLAEDEIRIFAEQSRMRHEEGDHGATVNHVLQVQMERSANKRRATHETCREVVLQLVSTLDYGDDAASQSSQTADQIRSTAELTIEVLDFIGRQLGSAPSDESSGLITSFADLHVYDSWLPYSALSANIGHWSVSPTAVQIGSGAGNDSVEEGDIAGGEVGKISLFLESTQGLLEALLAISCGGAGSGISLALSADEQSDLYSSSAVTRDVVLLLGGGTGANVCADDMLLAIDWLGGGSKVEVWDVAAAIDIGKKVMPLLEGKNPSISFSTLIDVFTTCPVGVFAVARSEGAVPKAPKTPALTPKALKVAAEIADATNRIMTSSHFAPTVAPAPTGGKDKKEKASPAPVTSFTEITFGVLLGQVLWMRNYLKGQHEESWTSVGEAEGTEHQSPPSSPFAPIVIATRCVHADVSNAGDDSVSFALAVDWFSRGGSRESANDVTTDNEGKRLLREALTLESETIAGAGIKKSKEKAAPKGKGAVVEVEPLGQSLLHGILRVASNMDPSLQQHTIMSESAQSVLSSAQSVVRSAQSAPSVTEPKEGSKVITDPLSTPTRRLFSSYSKHHKPSTEAPVEAVSSEPIMIETASSASIPYLLLVQAGGDKETSPEPSTAVVFSPGISASETLLSFVLASSKHYCDRYLAVSSPLAAESSVESPDIPLPDAAENHVVNIFSNIMSVIAKRRRSLSDAEQLWLLHVSNSNPIDLVAAYRAHGLCVESQAFEVELMGALLMSFGLSIADIERESLRSEAELICSLKVSDSRLQDICQQVQQQLLCRPPPPRPGRGAAGRGGRLLSKEEVEVVTSNCVCGLGDILDDRHMHWISLAASQRAALEDRLESFKGLVQRLSNRFGEAVVAAHGKKMGVGRAVSELLANAQYNALPWALPHSGSRATRRAADVRKDRLRSAALLLAASCSREYNDDVDAANVLQVGGTGEASTDPWRCLNFLGHSAAPVDSLEEGLTLSDSVADELCAETLESSVSLLSALHCGVTSLEARLQDHFSGEQSMIVSRYTYEHASLARWTSALRESLDASLATSGTYNNSILCSHYFDVTADAADDMVPSKVGTNVLELEDLTLSPSVLRSLSAVMNANTGAPKDLLTEESCCDLIWNFVSETGADFLLSAWQQEEQLRHLAHHALAVTSESSPPQGFEGPVSRKAFVQALVMVLLLAAVPAPPSGDFIMRLGEIFGGVRGAGGEGVSSFSFPSSGRPSSGNFRKIVSGDAKLAASWHRSMKCSVDDERYVVDMGDALSAVSSCCEDAEGRVVVEQVMLLLCRCPSRAGSFERSLLLHADTLSDMDPQSDAPQLPSFLSEGIYKALAVTSRIKDESSPSDMVSSGCISSSQLQWLLEVSPDRIPLALEAAVGDVEVFRPAFALQDGPLTADSLDTSLVTDTILPPPTAEDQPISRDQGGALTPPLSVSLLEGVPASIADIAIGIYGKIAVSGAGRVPFCV